MQLKKYICLAILFCALCNATATFAGQQAIHWNEYINVVIGKVENEAIYQRFAKGQCTWYAWGRFYEVHHKKIRFKEKLGLDAKLWPALITNCQVDKKPTAKAIAVSTSGRYGHLIFIEHITADTIYYTEANGDANGLYNRGVDCVLKRTDKASAFLQEFTWFIHP